MLVLKKRAFHFPFPVVLSFFKGHLYIYYKRMFVALFFQKRCKEVTREYSPPPSSIVNISQHFHLVTYKTV